MRIFALVGFLVLFLLTAILIGGNASYRGDFYFLAPFDDSNLAIGFLGFSVLGFFVGIFGTFFLSFFKKHEKEKQITEN